MISIDFIFRYNSSLFAAIFLGLLLSSVFPVSALPQRVSMDPELQMRDIPSRGVEAFYQPTQKHKPLMRYNTYLCGLDFALGVYHPMFMIFDKIISYKLSKR